MKDLKIIREATVSTLHFHSVILTAVENILIVCNQETGKPFTGLLQKPGCQRCSLDWRCSNEGSSKDMEE